MNKEEEKYINELIDKFNNMTQEEQQEELKSLYTTSEISYVEISEKYRDAVRRLREIQKQFKDKKYL
jgi:5'-deoxynucleotidase YfbR-like HD superfamily hydrolase